MDDLTELIETLQRRLDLLNAAPQPRPTAALLDAVARLTYMLVGLRTARELLAR